MIHSPAPPAYARWPFEPSLRTVAQEAQWWQECYQNGTIYFRLTDVNTWTIITGDVGSGKSIALQKWRQEEADRTLFIDYPPARWPGRQTLQPGHLMPILSAAARALYQRIVDRPELAAALDDFRREFLRWLLEQTGDPRMYGRLVSELGDQTLQAAFHQVPPAQMNEGDDALRLYSLVSDLTNLVHGLGLERVIVVVELSTIDTADQLDQLRDLYGWLTLMEHPSLLLVAAMPERLAQQASLLELSRGRVNVCPVEWTEEQCRAIARAHLRQSAPHLPDFDALARPELLARLKQTILDPDYERPNPGAWVSLVETLLYAAGRPVGARLPCPMPLDAADELRVLFYTRHVPLRLDAYRQGVWRGPRFIPLNGSAYELVALLYQHTPRPVILGSQEMAHLSGTPDELHTLVSRTRRQFEPVSGRPVYLLTEQGRTGYRLEKACRR